MTCTEARPGKALRHVRWEAERTPLDVSVVIVNWNTAEVLQCCLHTVRRALTTLAGECIVVDNASAPSDVALLRRECRGCSLVENTENRGFAGAANQGLRRCRGRHVLLLNPDTVLDHGCLEHLVRYLDDHPDVAIVGPGIFDLNGNVQGSARAFPGLLTAFFGRRSFLTRRFPSNAISRLNVPALSCDRTHPTPVDWVSGACLLARRSAVETIGLLDEGFVMYWEDADLCWRLRKAGWQVVYDPRARAVHLVGASSEQAPIRSAIHFHRSAFRFYRKHVTGRALHPMNALVAPALVLRASFVAAARLRTRRRVTSAT